MKFKGEFQLTIPKTKKNWLNYSIVFKFLFFNFLFNIRSIKNRGKSDKRTMYRYSDYRIGFSSAVHRAGWNRLWLGCLCLILSWDQFCERTRKWIGTRSVRLRYVRLEAALIWAFVKLVSPWRHDFTISCHFSVCFHTWFHF